MRTNPLRKNLPSIHDRNFVFRPSGQEAQKATSPGTNETINGLVDIAEKGVGITHNFRKQQSMTLSKPTKHIPYIYVYDCMFIS